MRWIVFVGIAVAVVALDQLAKADRDREPRRPAEAVEIVGDYLRIVFGAELGRPVRAVPGQRAWCSGSCRSAVIALIVGVPRPGRRAAST